MFKKTFLFAFALLFSLTANAQAAVFSDNFDDGNFDGWSVVQNEQSANPAQPCMNGGVPAAWEVVGGKVRLAVNGDPCVTVLAVDNLDVSQYNSYVYRFSMFYEGEALANRNLVFAWHDSANWMGLMSYGDMLYLQKVIGGVGTSFTDLSVASVPYDFTDNTLYDYELIVTAGKYVTVKINDVVVAETVDSGNPLPAPLTVGFQVGVGADPDTAVQYDDVEVVNSQIAITQITARHPDITLSGESNTFVNLTDNKTFDGNIVHFDVALSNSIGISQAWTLRLREGSSVLSEQAFMLEPNGSQVVSGLTWDTLNTAWNANGTRADAYTLTVEVESSFGYVWSTATIDIIVRPRPVVLIHGWRNDASLWNEYVNHFLINYPDWPVLVADDLSTGHDAGRPFKNFEQNAVLLKSDIDLWRAQLNARYFDLVGYSMGGLIGRAYLHMYPPEIQRPFVPRLITLGTPHLGTVCSSVGTFVAARNSVLDQVAELSGFSAFSRESVADFNRTVKNTYGTSLSALAGKDVSWPCPVGGDGVVPVASALGSATDQLVVPGAHHVCGSNPDCVLALTHANSFVIPRLQADWTPSAPPAPVVDWPSLPQERETDPETPPLLQTAVVTIPANGTTDWMVQISEGTAMGVISSETSGVGYTLLDPQGNPVFSLSAEDASAVPFPGVSADNPTPGVWTLRLNNSTGTAQTVLLGAWVTGLTIDLDVNVTVTGKNATVSAVLVNNAAPATGAVVTAKVVEMATGTSKQITLLDNGLAGDAAANDGIYTGKTGVIHGGWLTAVVEATHGGKTVLSGSTIDVPPVNILGNGGFETGLKPWAKVGTGAAKRLSGANAHGGTYFYQMRAGATGYTLNQTVAVQGVAAGEKLSLNAWVFVSKTAVPFDLMVKVFYANKTTKTFRVPKTLIAGQYAWQSGQWTLAAKPVKVMVTARMRPGSGTARLDDVSLTVAP